MKIEITTNKPLSVNAIWRRGRGKSVYKTEEAKAWQEITAWLIKDKVEKPFKKCKVSVKFYFGDRRKRDIDNLTKLIGDAIVDSGLIKDDDYKTLVEWNVRGYQDLDNPRTEIKISEI